MSTKNLREKRARVIEQARSIYDSAESEKRAPTAEETRSFDAFMDEAESLKSQIDRLERLEEEERALEASLGRRTTDVTRTATTDELRTWLLSGKGDFSFELRALSSGSGSAGGYTIPEDFSGKVDAAMLAFGGMRSASSVIRTASGADLPWPTLNDTTNKGRLLGESVAATETDLTFGQVVFKAFKFSSDLIRVPVELLQDSGIDLGAEIGARLGERLGRIQNQYFTSGTGTNQPQGVVPAAAVGVTGAAGNTTSITYDALVDLTHSVDPAYRASAKFMFHDTTLKALKKMKDSDGRPLWMAGMAEREPDTILGFSYVINQDVPVMAANARSIVFGDLSKHKIRDVRDIQLVRLNERYMDQHQIAFLAFYRGDSRLIDAGTNPVKVYVNSAT